jgi:pimeloyl-ACP methyl ester carboxylesterase
MFRSLLLFVLACCAWAAGTPDTLTVSFIDQESRMFVKSATGVWWPAQPKSSKASFPHHAAKSGVVVWFHGGMTSGNCQKGLVAGDDFAKLFPDVVVVSVSACRDKHWATEAMVSAIDAALDSVAKRRASFVEEVSLVGVSDGALGVMVYSMHGKRRVKDRLLASSFGKLLGSAAAVAGASPRMREGRWRFLQGGNDRLFPSGEAQPWIEEFCREVRADCMLRFDPAGEHDWSYWREKHVDWVREAVRAKK